MSLILTLELRESPFSLGQNTLNTVISTAFYDHKIVSLSLGLCGNTESLTCPLNQFIKHRLMIPDNNSEYITTPHLNKFAISDFLSSPELGSIDSQSDPHKHVEDYTLDLFQGTRSSCMHPGALFQLGWRHRQ